MGIVDEFLEKLFGDSFLVLRIPSPHNIDSRVEGPVIGRIDYFIVCRGIPQSLGHQSLQLHRQPLP